MDNATSRRTTSANERGYVMKNRTKIICMGLAAFIAPSALAASAEAADEWYTNTTETGTFTALALVSNVAVTGTSGISTLAVPKAGSRIECKDDTWTGTIQNASTGGVVEAHITVTATMSTGCQLKGTSTEICQVRSKGQTTGTITTNALTGKTNTGTGVNIAHVLLAPAPGTVITEIEILGAECSVRQLSPVQTTGTLEGALTPGGEVASQTPTFDFPATALSGTTLKYGSNPATLVSTESAKTSGTWIKLQN